MNRIADTSNLMLECEIPVIQKINKVFKIKNKPRIIYLETGDLTALKRFFGNQNLQKGARTPVLRDAMKLDNDEMNENLMFPDNILYINVHEYNGASGNGGFTTEIRNILDGYIKNLVMPDGIPGITERCYVLFGKLSDEDFEHYDTINTYCEKIIIPSLTPNDIDTLLDCYGFEENEELRKAYRRELECFDRETACIIFESISSDIPGGVNNQNGAMKKIKEFKHNLCGSSGVLKPVFSPEASSFDITPKYNAKGLDNLYEWLMLQYPGQESACRYDFKACSLLLLGVPGIGKTTFAKDVASYLNVDLYMLKIGDILNKYVGESEKKIKKILNKMAFLSPCVLMIDEIEKCLSGSNGRDGTSSSVSQHILQVLLEFMDDKSHRVFTVATANSIDNLPPELFRTMRFDGKFALFLPEKEACIDILEFHLSNNGYNVSRNKTRDEAEKLFREIVGDEGNPDWFLSGSDLCHAATVVCGLYNSEENINEDKTKRHDPHEFYKTVKPFLSYSVYTRSIPSVRRYAEMYYDLMKQSLPCAGKGKMVSSEENTADTENNSEENGNIKVWKFSSEKMITYESLSDILSENGMSKDDGEATYDTAMNRILKKEIRSVAKRKGDI